VMITNPEDIYSHHLMYIIQRDLSSTVDCFVWNRGGSGANMSSTALAVPKQRMLQNKITMLAFWSVASS
jgi:hypothetical protein